MICRHRGGLMVTWKIQRLTMWQTDLCVSPLPGIAPNIEDPDAIYEGIYLPAVLAHCADNNSFDAGMKSNSISIDEQTGSSAWLHPEIQ